MIYENVGGRNYIPRYEFAEYDGSLRKYETRNKDKKIRFNQIIKDYDTQECFFFESDDEFFAEFFTELLF